VTPRCCTRQGGRGPRLKSEKTVEFVRYVRPGTHLVPTFFPLPSIIGKDVGPAFATRCFLLVTRVAPTSWMVWIGSHVIKFSRASLVIPHPIIFPRLCVCVPFLFSQAFLFTLPIFFY